MFTFPDQPSSVAKIIALSWQFYRKTFSKMWFVFALYWLTSLFWLMGSAFGLMPIDIAHKSPSPRHTAALLIFFSVGAFVTLLALGLKWLALHRIFELSRSPAINFGESVRIIKEKFFTLLVNQFLVALIVILLLIPFILPGIIAMVWLMFCVLLILFSGHTVTSSIRASFDLVWGKWWRTFFVLLLPLAISYVISLGIPYWEKHSLFASGHLPLRTLEFLLGLFDAFVILPWLWSTIVVQFHDLQLRQRSSIN